MKMNLYNSFKQGIMDGERYRNELKYVCSEGELALIEARVKNLCRRDSHVDDSGIYRIRSVYFDDSENSCYYENENGITPREKFRIRIYNGNAERISLECKRKERGMTHKASCSLTRAQCEAILDGSFVLKDTQKELLSKFYLQYKQRFLRAKTIVAYERTPYVYAAGNVRITFDRNLGGSNRVKDFFEEQLPLRPVMPPGKHVLEVKYDAFLPDFLYHAMSIESLQQTTYSKYYLCRKFT